jgi:hypothetical protein
MELKLNDPGLDWRSHGVFVPRQECAAKRMRKAFIVSAVKTVDRYMYTRLLTADEHGREQRLNSRSPYLESTWLSTEKQHVNQDIRTGSGYNHNTICRLDEAYCECDKQSDAVLQRKVALVAWPRRLVFLHGQVRIVSR